MSFPTAAELLRPEDRNCPNLHPIDERRCHGSAAKSQGAVDDCYLMLSVVVAVQVQVRNPKVLKKARKSP